ncbi:MAG: hypothetical protein VX269_01000 [Verrucomicrobiota bacterium]|nr:hypothetical protein [Verrucomicrobiota bacterium]
MKINNLVLIISILVPFCGAVSAKVFEDQFGRIINAELVSHTGAEGESVTIKKSGKNIVVKVALFSEKDQKFIRGWMEETPPTVDYNFRVDIAKKEIQAKPSANPFEKSSEKSTAYLIRLTNLIRYPVSGLRVEYRAYMKDYGGGSSSSRGSSDDNNDKDDNDDGGGGRGGFSEEQIEEYLRNRFGRGRGSRGSSRGSSSKPKIIHIEESKEIEEVLKYNEYVTIESKPMRLDSGKMRYSSARWKDELIGVIVRVFEPGGEMVYEYRDQSTKDYIWAESSGPIRGFTDEGSDEGSDDRFDNIDKPIRGFTGE